MLFGKNKKIALLWRNWKLTNSCLLYVEQSQNRVKNAVKCKRCGQKLAENCKKKTKRAQKRGQLDGPSPSVWKDEEIKHKHKRGIAIYNLPNVYILAHFP